MWDFILLTSAPAFASDGKNTRQRFPVLEWAAGIFTAIYHLLSLQATVLLASALLPLKCP